MDGRNSLSSQAGDREVIIEIVIVGFYGLLGSLASLARKSKPITHGFVERVLPM
jgi:hypothetical protein